MADVAVNLDATRIRHDAFRAVRGVFAAGYRGEDARITVELVRIGVA